MQDGLLDAAPPIEEIQPWWPLIVACISGIGFICSSLWAAYTAMRNSHAQNEADKMKMEFETRKDFVDDLMSECKLLREECSTQRQANMALMESIIDRDAKIRGQADEIAVLTKKTIDLQVQIDKLTSHVAALEKARE